MFDSVEDFLEHYGVQGMRWGQRRATNKERVASLREGGLTRRQARNTNRAQNRIDAQRMVASRRNGEVSVLRRLQNRGISNSSLSLGTVIRHPLSTTNAATRQLEVNTRVQTDIQEGRRRVQGVLLRAGGISVSNLDFSID